MKRYLTILFVLAHLATKAQKFKALKAVSGSDTVKSGQGIIYGTFIQRLGFSSGGFPQDIRVINLDTEKYFSFRVKATFKSAKENFFSYHIPPGNYAIVQYWWTKSKWYGGEMFTEPVVKSYPSAEVEIDMRSGEITGNLMEYYRFSIQPNTVHYLGTWHFDKKPVSFSDDKNSIDENVSRKLEKIDLRNAMISIPD